MSPRTSINAAPASAMLSLRSRTGTSSAIRDLLSQAKRPGMISLAGGLPDSGSFPTEPLAEIAQRMIRDHGQEVLQYGETQGDWTLRSILASWMPSSSPEQVVITTGSQQALDLLGRTVIEVGDEIVVSDPEYLGALQVFRSHGAVLRPMPTDGFGLDTAHLEQQLRDGLRPKACYFVPNFHNPTGASMTHERRMHLAHLADHYGFLLIEDDPYRDLYFDTPVAATSPLASDRHVQLRSTSKSLSPGLRVGAMSGPDWLIEPVVIAKQSCDLHTSTLTQAIVAEALVAEWYQPHLEKLRNTYRLKRDALIGSLAGTFGDAVSVESPGGGMFLWATFDGTDTNAWLPAALQQGVCFVPGQAFTSSESASQEMRLSFATPTTIELVEGVRRLHASWATRH